MTSRGGASIAVSALLPLLGRRVRHRLRALNCSEGRPVGTMAPMPAVSAVMSNPQTRTVRT